MGFPSFPGIWKTGNKRKARLYVGETQAGLGAGEDGAFAPMWPDAKGGTCQARGKSVSYGSSTGTSVPQITKAAMVSRGMGWSKKAP